MTNTLTIETRKNELKAERAEFLQTNPEALNYQLRKESIETLRGVIVTVSTIAELDQEKIGRRIKAAMSSEYGRVPGMLNLLASIVHWPTDDSVENLNDTRDAILTNLGMDETIFTDLRDVKGYHTFISDEHEMVAGIEPDYDEYTMLCNILANELNLSVVDMKLTENAWDKAESKALTKAEADIKHADEAITKHKSMMSAFAS